MNWKMPDRINNFIFRHGRLLLKSLVLAGILCFLIPAVLHLTLGVQTRVLSAAKAQGAGSRSSDSADSAGEVRKSEKEADGGSGKAGKGNKSSSKPLKKKSARIYVKNMIMDASDICRRDKQLAYTCDNKEKARYFSDSDKVTVENGVVSIPANYAGKSHVTVIIPESEEYAASSARILIAVNPIENTIKTNDIQQEYDQEKQTIPVDVEARGRAKLSYRSSTSAVSVRNGQATIRKGYSGTAEITVTAKASGIYKETSKTFKITVLSGIAEKLVQKAQAEVGVSGGGANNTKYGQFTGANRQAWCASFVSWCASEAGVNSLKPGVRSVLPKTASTLAMCQYSTDYHVWSEDALNEMKRGDVIFFSRAEKRFQVNGKKSVCHVGIIESIDTKNNKIDVIEGNSSGDRVCRKTYLVDPSTGRIRRRYFCGYICIH